MRNYLLFFALAGAAGAQTVSVSADFTSKYLWRGINVLDRSIVTAAATVSGKGFRATVAGIADTELPRGRGNGYKELDLDFGYDVALGERVTVGLGVLRYNYFHTPYSDFTEAYYGISVAAPSRPSLRMWTDLDPKKGSFLAADFSHSLALPLRRPGLLAAIEFSGGLGWATRDYNTWYFSSPNTGFSDLHAAIAAPVTFGTKLRLTPRLGYAHVPDARFRGPDSALRNARSFGASLAYTF